MLEITQSRITRKKTASSLISELKRKTRKAYSSEEKIRIVIEGIRGELSIAFNGIEEYIAFNKISSMPNCLECGSYTKFNGGLCGECYADSKLIKEKSKKPKENPWVSGVIKGRIAETIGEELFRSLGFQVYKYGMEHSIPGITELLKGVKDEVALNIRKMPDFVIFKNNRAHFIEVKFRASEKFSLKDIDKDGDYPFHNALILLVSKKHIKCISYEELKAGKEISTKCQDYLGNRKEFDVDKDVIREYCKYANKYFETA